MMKQRTNITLLLYEYTLAKIHPDKINNKWLGFLIAFPLFFLTLPFILIALLIEEPIKCIFAVIFEKTSPSDAFDHYKQCWKALQGGMKQ